MPTSSLSCLGCGAPAPPEATACAYCGCVLGAVACASCFATMPPGSKFCAHCGAAAAREVVDETAPLACPGCRGEMQAVLLGATTLRECPDCGALWLDGESFERICAAREQHATVLRELSARTRAAEAGPSGAVRYRGCPECAKIMNRVNFARCSGIVIDVCKAHGVWLDPGELRRVIGFVDEGGLELARAKERERLAEEQRRLREEQQRLGVHPLAVDAGPGGWHASSTRDRGARRAGAAAELSWIIRRALDLD